MGADFNIKRGSLLPPFEQTLNFSGTLSGCTVVFKMTKKGDTVPTVNAGAVIVDAALRKVKYDWVTGDTNVAGEFNAEFEVEFPGGDKQSFPADRYYQISVRPELNGVPLPPPDLSGIVLVTAPLYSTGGGTPRLEIHDIVDRAAVSAITGQVNGCLARCREVAADYLYDSASSATVDGWTVLTASGGGRWLLQGDTISLAPLGGTADDWPRLFGTGGAAAAMAYKGWIVLRPGTWYCKSAHSVPNGLQLKGSPGVTIISTMTFTGTQRAVFHRQPVISAPNTTLAANNTPGATTLSTVATVAVGTTIRVQILTGLRVRYFSVLAVSGSGPYTLTLDRPCLDQFSTGDLVDAADQTKDIKILGGGMKITGTGDRAFELWGALRCHVEDVHVVPDSGSFTDVIASFDLGNRLSFWNRCSADGGGISTDGFAIEGGEHSAIIDCYVRRLKTDTAGAAYHVSNANGCSIVRCHATDCNFGAFIGTQGDNLGGLDNSVIGGSYYGNIRGVSVGHGKRTHIIGVSSCNNSLYGIEVTQSQIALDTLISNCFASNNTQAGFNVEAGNKRTVISNCSANNNGGSSFRILDECDLVNVRADGGTLAMVVSGLGASSVVRVRNFEFTSTSTWAGVQVTGSSAGRVMLDGGKLTTTGTGSIGVQHLSANVVVLSDVEGSGGSGSYGYAGVSGATLRRHGRVDFSGYPTAISIDAAGYSNIGTVTLNGASAVDYNFADIKATDPVRLTRKTAGGTPGPSPTFVVTAGTKVAVTGTSGDTSVYEIQIG